MEEHADGLQILRYNASTSYKAHLDYMDGDATLEHDFDSAHKGGNRFATILLYMTDMEEGSGGELVFANAWPNDVPEGERVNLQQVSVV
jgi:Rps23 Pro-64 3,4-dihydroxylase Tpa1-like proline 4-hydroxylase